MNASCTLPFPSPQTSHPITRTPQLNHCHHRCTPHASSLTHRTPHCNPIRAGPCARGRLVPAPLSPPAACAVSASSPCTSRPLLLGPCADVRGPCAGASGTSAAITGPCTALTTASGGSSTAEGRSGGSWVCGARGAVGGTTFGNLSSNRNISCYTSSRRPRTTIPVKHGPILPIHPRVKLPLNPNPIHPLHPTPSASFSLRSPSSQTQSQTPRSILRSISRSRPWSSTSATTPASRPAVTVRGLQQNAEGGPSSGSPGGDSSAPSAGAILFRKVVRSLASLPLAIAILFAIAGTCALGKSPLPRPPRHPPSQLPFENLSRNPKPQTQNLSPRQFLLPQPPPGLPPWRSPFWGTPEH